MANILGCQKSCLPFTYLGVPVGANMSRKSNWQPVINKFTSKLSIWKAKTLSFGGRLTLVKSVLGSIPTYYLSLFKAPSGVIESLEKIRRRFLWGGNEQQRKIHWVSWSKIVAEKSNGGLGVGTLKAQNIALLTKWWWRLKNEKGNLWAEVVNCLHKLERRPSTFLSRKTASGVWSSISKAIYSLNSYNIDYNSLFSLVPGANIDILFWKDVWCGGDSLQNRFPTLYQLEMAKTCKIFERIMSTGFNWKWRRRPTQQECSGELHDFYTWFGAQVPPNPGVGGFRFNFSDDGVYSVKIMRKIIDFAMNSDNGPIICWSKSIPIKVKCFVWRAILGRIPVADTLRSRGIIVQSDQCGLCGTQQESVNHLLIECEFSKSVHAWILNWCGIPNRNFQNTEDFVDYANTWGGCRRRREVLNVIFFNTLWNLWLTRNNKVFKLIRSSPAKVADSIVTQSFEWWKNRGKGASSNWIDWISSPFSNL